MLQARAPCQLILGQLHGCPTSIGKAKNPVSRMTRKELSRRLQSCRSLQSAGIEGLQFWRGNAAACIHRWKSRQSMKQLATNRILLYKATMLHIKWQADTMQPDVNIKRYICPTSPTQTRGRKRCASLACGLLPKELGSISAGASDFLG